MESKTKTSQNELKIIVVGNSGTGKTCFVNKWTKGEFSESYKATIVSEFSHKVVEIKGKFYKIQVWDLAGMDQNTCITKIFAKDAHGCVVVSDITNEKTLEATIKWKNSVDDSTRFLDGDYLPSVLVRNKVDLINNNDDNNTNEDDERVKEFAEKNNFINIFKTSAKMGIGIDECMNYLIENIIERIEKFKEKEGKDPLVKDVKNIVIEKKKVSNNNDGNKIKGCC